MTKTTNVPFEKPTFDLILASNRVESRGYLVQFKIVARAMAHKDRFNEAVAIAVL
jgi:hypothetical protein